MFQSYSVLNGRERKITNNNLYEYKLHIDLIIYVFPGLSFLRGREKSLNFDS